MTPEQWGRIQDALATALGKPAAERVAYLRELEGRDPTRHAEVTRLLASEAPESFLESPPDAVGALYARASGDRAVTDDPYSTMSLGIGMKLGSFEITGTLGAGGMGEVYRAHDSTLHREVALKILPEVFAEDPERLARFKREAQALASLNHPNIATIYGFEEVAAPAVAGAEPVERPAIRFLVLELVEGPTLGDQIREGPVPVEEAVGIARQLTEALEAAHDAGIIHRDLKPANIKLREDGGRTVVKVLDFGLAKLAGPAAGYQSGSDPAALTASPTLTTPAQTMQGVILGTAAYMSPEQARGRPVDKRADVWAFGAVLYEMLTGRRAFDGEDVTDTIAAVVRSEPDWNAVPTDLSASVLGFLKRCLQKDPRQRVGDIRDVRLALEGAFETPADASAMPIPALPGWRRALPFVLTAAVAAGIGLGAAWVRTPTVPSRPVVRSVHTLPDGRQFRSVGRQVLTIAPDGRHFVYNGTDGLYLRALDTVAERLIPGTEEQLASPALSPDGESVVFHQDGQLKRIALTGGGAQTLADAGNTFGISWNVDGTILYGQADGIWQVSENGGEPRHLIAIGDGEQASGPQRLPGGDWVLFTLAGSGSGDRWDRAEIVAASPATGERRVVLTGGSDGRFLPTGHLAYTVGSVLYAAAFDVDRLELAGEPVPVIQDVQRAQFRAFGPGSAFHAVAADGTLVYAMLQAGANVVRRRLVWVDHDGQETSVDVPPADYRHPRVSPDGTQISVSVIAGEEGRESVWVVDAIRGTSTRVTTDPPFGFTPIWTPNGRQLIYAGNRESGAGFYRRSSDGTGDEQYLVTVDGANAIFPGNMPLDGSSLVFDLGRTDGDSDIGVLSLDEQPSWAALIQTNATESWATVSPDGQWVAYVSDESGRSEVYLQPFPDLGDRRTVSRDGGLDPWWSPDGRTLYYLRGNAAAAEMVAVPIDPASPLSIGTSRVLFERPYVRVGRNYAVAPDGERFVFVADAEAAQTEGESGPQIMIVQNFFQQLTRLVPTE